MFQQSLAPDKERHERGDAGWRDGEGGGGGGERERCGRGNSSREIKRLSWGKHPVGSVPEESG